MPPKKQQLEPTWSRPEISGTIPTRRSGHSLTYSSESDVCFMFGGMRLGSDGGQLTNELYRLNMQAGGAVHWSKETAAGRVPPPTWRHTANEFDSNKILIFGGFTGEVERTDEVWVLNTEHMTWSRPVASSSALLKGGVDSSMQGSSSSGGSGEHAQIGQQQDEHGGHPLPPQGPQRPSPRGSHSAAVVEQDLVVFGGYGGNGFARSDFSDLYALSLTDWQWRAVEAHGTAPDSRSGHTSNVIMGRWMFVVGGW